MDPGTVTTWKFFLVTFFSFSGLSFCVLPFEHLQVGLSVPSLFFLFDLKEIDIYACVVGKGNIRE